MELNVRETSKETFLEIFKDVFKLDIHSHLSFTQFTILFFAKKHFLIENQRLVVGKQNRSIYSKKSYPITR